MHVVDHLDMNDLLPGSSVLWLIGALDGAYLERHRTSGRKSIILKV